MRGVLGVWGLTDAHVCMCQGSDTAAREPVHREGGCSERSREGPGVAGEEEHTWACNHAGQGVAWRAGQRYTSTGSPRCAGAPGRGERRLQIARVC